MQCKIDLPDHLNVKGSMLFSQTLKTTPYCNEYLIDFSSLVRAFPFAILVTVASIREFVRNVSKSAALKSEIVKFHTKGIDIKNNPLHGYFAHIGFFQDIGVNVGRHAGEAWGGEGYVPIRHIKRNEIIEKAVQKSLHHGEVLIHVAEELSTVISKMLKPESTDIQSEYIFKVMAYSIREILRNSIEHSESTEIIVCGQSLPRIGCAEIAILDNGIGIHSSLAQVHGYKDVRQSLLHSIKPGISSKLDLSPDNKWGNSGFGLYATKRMCTYFPEDQFAIASSGCAYSLFNSDKYAFYGDLMHHGTTVMLKMQRHDDYYFENILEKIIEEGEEEAKVKVPSLRASKMSKVLK